MSEEQVSQLVREHLRDRHPGGVTINVMEHGIRREGDYWYVPVRPTTQPVQTFEYYDALADVETELSEAEHIKVLLVPTLPE